ncbi:hypothetical protein MHH60_26300 [Paenibacillus sp. FSL H7-0716]|uniref:hypothetical protein n=1 Tax=Paenibacillus TaxID=44249 RepID=UPI0015C3F93B|nr:hypothetical protein [Paenibacillus odorifer]
MKTALEIHDYNLMDEDYEEFLRRGFESYGIPEGRESVVNMDEIHSILIVNM